MSLWLPGPTKNGKRPLYSIGAEPLQVIATIALLIAIALPMVRWLRDLLGG